MSDPFRPLGNRPDGTPQLYDIDGHAIDPDAKLKLLTNAELHHAIGQQRLVTSHNAQVSQKRWDRLGTWSTQKDRVDIRLLQIEIVMAVWLLVLTAWVVYFTLA